MKNSQGQGNKVEVQNDNVEKALRLLKKKVQEDGLLQTLKEREFYEKPTTRRRRVKNQQQRRAQKRREADQMPKKLY